MATHELAGNFLVPNATFFAELIAFVLILVFIARVVVPPVQRGMRARQKMLQQQVEDSDKAREKLTEAEQAYQKALTEARTEAAQIRENARAEAQRTLEELRGKAQEESDRIIARGEEQLKNQRASIVRELRGELGGLAVELSEKIVHQRLADEANVRATVDSFLADLERHESGNDNAATNA